MTQTSPAALFRALLLGCVIGTAVACGRTAPTSPPDAVCLRSRSTLDTTRVPIRNASGDTVTVFLWITPRPSCR